MKNNNLWSSIIPFIISTFMTNFNTVSAQDMNNESITMLVTFNVKADQKEALKEALIADKNGALMEEGNISMALYQHNNKPNTLYLFERWDNKKSLDKHFTNKYAQDVLELNKTALTQPMEIVYLHDVAPLPKNEIKQPLVSDKPVDIIVTFKVKAGMQDIFTKQFDKSIVNSRPEPGNIAFFFHSVPRDNRSFVLFERWKNKEAIDFHFAQPYTKELFEIFKSALEQPIEEYLNFVTEIK